MASPVKPEGPIPAKIMLVGEAPGAEEERLGRPFVGASGYELDRMLHDAGISRSECFITNLCRIRPPNNDINQFIAKAKKDRTSEHVKLREKWVLKPVLEGFNQLQTELQAVQPNVVIALGGSAAWALAGVPSITRWRGSMLYCDLPGKTDIKVIPTIHPASVLREWKQRIVVVHDLRRAARFKNGEPYPKPNWQFILRPSYEQATTTLDQLQVRAHHSEPLRISFDLETRAGHIACAGLAWSRTHAICIPFMAVSSPQGYWSSEEEAQIVWRLQKLLCHPNVQVIGQNIIYDSQYTWKHWHFVPRVSQDTMISQHSVFSDLPKGLGFLASMYCDYYVYWKDEGKDFYKNVGA
jgi:uracil-DNA glycosylase